MNIIIKVLGVEVLSLRTGETPASPVTGAPDHLSTGVGFTGVRPNQGVPYA